MTAIRMRGSDVGHDRRRLGKALAPSHDLPFFRPTPSWIRAARTISCLAGLILLFMTPAQGEELTTRGVIAADARAVIAAELVARVTQLPLREGEHFSKGDLLVKFDCAKYEAEHRAAIARMRAEKSSLLSNMELSSHGALGTTELALSQARFDEAVAARDASAVRIRQCEIKAPFAGRMVTRHIQRFEMPQANAPLVEIVSSEGVEIEIIAPSNWLLCCAQVRSLTSMSTKRKPMLRPSCAGSVRSSIPSARPFA